MNLINKLIRIIDPWVERLDAIEARYAKKMNDPTKYTFKIKFQNGEQKTELLTYQEVGEVWETDLNHDHHIYDISRVE